MGDDAAELGRALREHGETVRNYVRVNEAIRDLLPRRRRSPLLMAAAVLLLIFPTVFLGGAAVGFRFGAAAPTEVYLDGTQVWASCVGVTVNPGDDLQALITANGTGTTFCLQPGTHRVTASGGLTPKTGDEFLGVQGQATVSGSKLVTGWAADGSDWVATGYLPATAPSGAGTCLSSAPLCNQPHDIFRDGVWLTPVSSRAALTTGTAYLDYPNNRIYVRDDPSGQTMEQSWAARLFTGAGTGVQIKNLTLQHAASLANTGAVDPASGGIGWVLDHNEIRWNHGYGTGPGHPVFGETLNLTVTANNVHHNGQDGTGGDGVGNVVRGNEVHHNSYAGYDPTWDAGNKFGHARNLVVDGNYYHDEVGKAIWCDINCEDVTISNNYVADSQAGIMFEISCGADIHDNIVVDSGTDSNGFGYPAIFIANSEGAEVYNNETYGGMRGIWALNTDRLTEPRDCTAGGEHVTKDLYVHDNSIDLTGPDEPWGGKVGLWNDQGRSDLYTSLNNRIEANTYHHPTPGPVFDWGMTTPPYSDTISFVAFQAAGLDTGGAVIPDAAVPPPPPALDVGPRPTFGP